MLFYSSCINACEQSTAEEFLMKVSFSKQGILESKAKAVVAFCFKGEEKNLRHFDGITNGLASKAVARKVFCGNNGETVSLDATAGFEKLIVCGLGEKKNFVPEVLRKACGAVAPSLRDKGLDTVAVELVGGDAKQNAKAITEGFLLGAFVFNKYKSKEKDFVERKMSEIMIAGNSSQEKHAQAGISLGMVVGETANFVRAINDEPANVATPEFLAQKALSLQGNGLRVTVFDKKALEKMGCGALLAVNAGSDKEPRMVLMEWNSPKRGGVAFVGKGITFDSGGISIKPAGNMDKMKFDKSGACAVIGLMKAVKEMHYPGRVVGIFAATENMLGGGAYKPGDIVKALNGKTIEILNTDAEGRVVLADALSLASEQKVDEIIEFSTLTGACMVALGDLCSGLMSNDKKLEEKLVAAGEASGERVWPLPTWLEYDEKVKSEYADVKNIGEPMMAGPVAGYSLLKLFVGENKYAHLDIAATADVAKPKTPYNVVGATGVGVRLGIEYLLQKK